MGNYKKIEKQIRNLWDKNSVVTYAYDWGLWIFWAIIYFLLEDEKEREWGPCTNKCAGDWISRLDIWKWAVVCCSSSLLLNRIISQHTFMILVGSFVGLSQIGQLWTWPHQPTWSPHTSQLTHPYLFPYINLYVHKFWRTWKRKKRETCIN